MERKIKNSFKLLSDIVEGLNKNEDESLVSQCYITFFKDDEELIQFDLIGALKVIAEDLHCNEYGNWSEANRAMVFG
jgi:hypothetical protein